jgi:hypothetical protein
MNLSDAIQGIEVKKIEQYPTCQATKCNCFSLGKQCASSFEHFLKQVKLLVKMPDG